MVNYLSALDMKPDIYRAGQQAFQDARNSAIAQRRDKSLAALAGGDQGALQDLAAVDPDAAFRYQERQERQRLGQLAVQRNAAMSAALAGMEGLPEPVRAYVQTTGDAEGGMTLFKAVKALSDAERAQAKAEAEAELASAIGSGRINDPAVRSRLGQVIGLDKMLDLVMAERRMALQERGQDVRAAGGSGRSGGAARGLTAGQRVQILAEAARARAAGVPEAAIRQRLRELGVD